MSPAIGVAVDDLPCRDTTTGPRPMMHILFVAALFAAASLAQPATTVATAVAAAAGWRAELIHSSDGGVWYAHVDKVVDAYGANEIIAGDDKGRLLLLTVYSGQWTAHSVVCDGQWLAPTRSADVDPRVPGREIYAGGRSGSIHRVQLRQQPFARFQLDSVEIGHVGGEEFHAVLADDLVPGGNDELLAFAISGAVYELVPAGAGESFTMRRVATVPGRVRDVAVAAGEHGTPATSFGVSRSGDLLAMRLSAGSLQHEVVLHEDCGLGRIALAKGRPGVLYVTRDDGVVVRAARAADGKWQREVVFAGGQGLRGVASGRFFADDREALAVYGYDQVVHLVWRPAAGGWQVETTLASGQKGHWLATGELDGRNGTDELVACGFDGKMLLLARPPGYALPGAAVPVEEREAAPEQQRGDGAFRVAARLGARSFTELSSLRYQGGFATKSLVYETLVRIGPDGRIAPGLATSWQRQADGRVFVFTLRQGAAWHDGKPVTAADVATHFRRWVGLPEHGWLRSNARIVSVQARAADQLAIELDRPAALLADLCAINPSAVMGPGSWSREGDFTAPIGSGPFVCLGAGDGNRSLRYRSAAGSASLQLVGIDGDAIDALLRADVDAVVSSWLVRVDPVRAAGLRRDARFQVVDGPGSSMWHLALRWHEGPLADLASRRAVAAAVDRGELIRVAAAGLGDASTSWAAPSIVDWPQSKWQEGALAVEATGNGGHDVRAQGRPSSPGTARVGPTLARPLRLATGDADPLLVATLVAQLQRAGIGVTVASDASARDWDLRLERTHGVPYDPFTIVERFGRPVDHATAAAPKNTPVDEVLASAVDGLLAAADETTWPRHFARIQARLDELLPVVPLFAPRRLALVRAGAPVPSLDHDLYRLDAAWLGQPR